MIRSRGLLVLAVTLVLTMVPALTEWLATAPVVRVDARRARNTSLISTPEPRPDTVITSRTRLRAIEVGRATAKEDIECHSLSILTGGISPQRGIDPQTGLPYWPICGCMPSDSLEGFMRGYGEVARRWLEENGEPSWSRRQWFKEFHSPDSFFVDAERDGRESSDLLEFDSLVSPNQCWILTGIKIAPETWQLSDPGSERDTRQLWALQIRDVENSRVYRTFALWNELSEKVLIQWGPAESDLVGIQCEGRRRTSYGTLQEFRRRILVDLRNGRWLWST